jgi:hypothetical protein
MGCVTRTAHGRGSKEFLLGFILMEMCKTLSKDFDSYKHTIVSLSRFFSLAISFVLDGIRDRRLFT